MTDDRREWRTLWIDQRKLSQTLVAACVVIAFIAWVLVSISVAESIPEKADAPVRVSDLVRFQWWAIAGLLGLVGVLIGFFIVREMNNTKSNVRSLWKEKLSTTEHEKIDHSLLCAKCRQER